jgi:hypothetical protein
VASQRLWISGRNRDLLIGNNSGYRDRTRRGEDFSYYSTGIIELAGSKSAKVYALGWAARTKDNGIRIENSGRCDSHTGFHRLQLFCSQFLYVGDALLFDRFVAADLIG